MDRFERIQRRRDEYESALDEADRLRDEYHREIVKLHRSGVSLREIAEGLGISHQRVHQIVTPLEERPRSRTRGRAAGAAGAFLILVATTVFALTRPGDPVSSRIDRSAPPAAATEPPVISCIWTANHPGTPLRCQNALQREGAVVVIDPRTGRVLARVRDAHVTSIDVALEAFAEDPLTN
jgi:DNA-binding CsgD family transcriptional regulator